MNKTPKYMEIIQWARTRIQEGKYLPGGRFPSEMELSARFGLSRQTVRHALDILESEGAVRRVRGSGTYVAEAGPLIQPRTMNIGIVSTYLDDYIFPGIIRGIETVLTGHGYAMQFAFTHNKIANEARALQAMLDKHVDGLIVEPTKSGLPCLNLDLYGRIQAEKLPLVFFNACYPGLSFPYVALDDQRMGFEATRYLLHAGHSRIAGIFLLDDRQGHLRYLGYCKALLEADLAPRDENILWYSTENRADFLSPPEQVLARLEDCTAILCYNDQLALRMIELLRSQGKAVPEEMSIIGIDNSDLAAMCDPPLTSLAHPVEALGRTAAETLIALLEGKPAGTTLFPPRIVQRGSVRIRG